MTNLYTYDCEVFAYDWLFVFKDIDSGEYTVIHNDNEAVKSFSLPVEKLIDVSVMTNREIQKQYVSSVGGAVAGAMLFGSVGAILGGSAVSKAGILRL